MSSIELTYWQEYYKLAPFGDDWLQAAKIAAACLQPWSRKEIKPERFIPKFRARVVDTAALEAKFAQFERRHNKAAV